MAKSKRSQNPNQHNPNPNQHNPNKPFASAGLGPKVMIVAKLSPIQELPLELLEDIAAYLPAQGYSKFRKCCKNTGALPKVAKLNLGAYIESANGWDDYDPLHYFMKDDWDCKTLSLTYEFTQNVHLRSNNYSKFAFRWMCENSLGAEIERMIESDPSILKNVCNSYDVKSFPLHWSCMTGNVKVVRILLQQSWVNPTDADEDGCNSLAFACLHNQVNIVQLLLQDRRVDPSRAVVNGQYLPVTVAAQRDNLGVVRLLLQDRRVDPSARDNEAICEASSEASSKSVKVLLEDSRVDPSARNNEPIRKAIENNDIDTFVMLLQDSRVDPSFLVLEAALWARDNGKTDIVKSMVMEIFKLKIKQETDKY